MKVSVVVINIILKLSKNTVNKTRNDSLRYTKTIVFFLLFTFEY